LVKFFLKNDKKLVEISYENDYGYDLKNANYHEAGFDSFATGWIFYQMHKFAD
jgi:hypothetical protein